MKKVLIAVEIVLILAIGAFLFFIYSGWYNIAATVGHYDVVHWVLETTMENSVRYHAQGIAVPPLENRNLQSAVLHFDRMCVMCHGAPGVEPSEVGKGIVPDPPDLAKAVQEWSPAELFWIVKNGIKMSGMPAFGPTHTDEEIWDIVAFLNQLPRLSPADYQALTEKVRQTPPEGHLHPENGHGHGQPHQSPVPGERPAGELRPNEDMEIETAACSRRV